MCRLDLLEINLTVGPHHEGWRLDRFVNARIPRLSRTRVQRMIRAQAGFGNEPLRPSTRVQGGQVICLLRPAPDEPDVPLHYEVVHEDQALLAICKPAGLPVHATATFHRHTLTALLQQQYGTTAPRLVHRLDRETSGVMLLARDAVSEAWLKRELERRQVHKTYMAIVNGSPQEEGTIDLPIGPDLDTGIRVRRSVGAHGLAAQTRYRTVGRRNGHSLVEAFPQTGRQHQIRVHLAAIGCPIVGDKLYGPDPSCLFEYLETGWTESLQQRLTLPRHALHASAITFTHPETGRETTAQCPLAEDLTRYWDELARKTHQLRVGS